MYGVRVVYQQRRDAEKIRRALAFLRRTSERAFFKVTHLLVCIAIVPGRRGRNGVFTAERVWITERPGLRYPSQYLASLLLHEAHHVAQARSGTLSDNDLAERNAYIVQRRYLQRIGYHNAVEWLNSQYKEQWWKRAADDGTYNRDFQKYLNLVTTEPKRTKPVRTSASS